MPAPATGKVPPRLARADSFFGLHFDFHANEKDRAIGGRTTPQSLSKLIRAVCPDYIQCDCKGHRGLSSYPTRVGHPAPGLTGDPLRVWRNVTARHGVALFMHHSGVWDNEALARHPRWARVDAAGKRDRKFTSVFGPYSVRLLIPQLMELADRYDVDGVWIDGDCWATEVDYRHDVIAAFKRATGLQHVPRDPADPRFQRYLEFCREGFRRYLRHYVDTMRRHAPRCQVTSNWAFSTFMPEPVSANLPFLSGDFSWHDSVNTARIESRWLAQQGLPWDLMAWSFSGEMDRGDWSTKSAPQLQREAASVMAQGGGFQIYMTQRRDGSIRSWQIPLLAEVARFCRARQPYCQGAHPVPQIALLYSGAAYYQIQRKPFGFHGEPLDPLRGILQALLDRQHAVDVVGEHHLRGRLSDYPIIIVPEWQHLEPPFRRALRAYVRAGGNLLLIGPRAAALFARDLGVTTRGPCEEKRTWLVHAGVPAALMTTLQPVAARPGTRTLGTLHPDNDPETPGLPAATLRRMGRGRIAAIHTNLGKRYRTSATPTVRNFLSDLVRELFAAPLVTVTGSTSVDVSLMRLHGQLAVHLVNTAGPHADKSVCVHDDIPPVGPLTISIRLPRCPKAVRVQPAGRRLRVAWKAGCATVRLPRLSIHDILVVEG